ncbi:trehalose operon repressor [Pseudolactococcus paracarnosus]|uniref:Trehalose operon repressor n=1 Tax=Pseudolactococcus paracarnosus TaxID=2749962 RepID=A0ABT0AN32_9LACT|nr:trehalose operon repressor [Lactococcus paracarnosus]MCJ1977874.1 trehalose operon repressor [Lactococcus paracarnosus]MCJ1983981.1 trehalose operon repressor [Lactococcus paracarnosus]MCJ1998127.1 trehalose operon repressor [Lactococcus paracarnosus]
MKKYEMILYDLEGKIKNKTVKENELLPSENELVKHYDASRATVRQALKILEERGLIQKQKGRGSVVIASSKLNFPISGLTSYKELQASLGFESSTHVVTFEKLIIDQELANQTLFKLGTEVWHILRTRQINGKAVVLDRDFIKYDIAPDMTREAVADSLYHYLENQLNIDISFAQKEITIDFINDEDKKRLDLNPLDRHVVSVKSHVFLNDATIFQYTDSRHQVDKFQFTEFARRQKR